MYHGKFAYRGIPRNAEFDGPPSSYTGPSLMAISKHSDNPEPTFLFLQWLVEHDTQIKAGQGLGGWIPVTESAWEDPFYAEGHFSRTVRRHEGLASGGRCHVHVAEVVRNRRCRRGNSAADRQRLDQRRGKA